APLAAAVTGLAQRSGASPFMVLLAGFLAVLARWTGQEDLVVGTPVANRRHSEVEGLIGLFVNTLVLRTDLDGDPSVRTLIERVKAVCLGAYAHQDLPFEQLVEELQPQRDLARNPLFQVVFNLLNTPMGRTGDAVPEGQLTMTPLTPCGGSSLFDLQGYVTHSDQGINIAWEYATDLYAATTIERISRSFEAVLEALAAHPEARLSDLPLLNEAESHQLTAEWNDTGASLGDLCLHELFAAQAALQPSAPAVFAADGTVLTYGDLDDRSSRVARSLRRRGIRPGDRVAVLAERSPSIAVATLGILKAGAAYVSLDPAHPAERRALLAADAGTALLLASENLAEHDETDGDLPAVVPDALAYVIYTSGSTGMPKGVMISHRQAVNT